jgi:hypothetical protein
MVVTSFAAPLLPGGITISGLIRIFILSFLTGGYALGLIYFDQFRTREYYFFYNQGISKIRLILISYLFHLMISFPLFMISIYG